MTDRRPPVDALSNLLDDLAEDLFSLSDEELRAELREDGESLEDYSAGFQAAFRAADSRLQSRQTSVDGARIAARLVVDPPSPQGSGVQPIHDAYGESKWGPRLVSHHRGPVEALLDRLPAFELAPFRGAAPMEEHPALQLVVRQQRGNWAPMAVGTVSRKYRLIQHADAVRMCLHGLERAGLEPSELAGEVVLSELGEWMNFSFVLPEEYTFRDTYGQEVEFRCDVANSVDRSSRLSVCFRWFRHVCSNGMVVPEVRDERRMHRSGLYLESVQRRIFDGIQGAKQSRDTLKAWQETRVSPQELEGWADQHLYGAWRADAAARVLYVCRFGHDAEFERDASGPPTKLLEDPPYPGTTVPGSPEEAETKYDVAQAMSWVASREKNVIRRVGRQAQIPALLDRLQAA